MNYFRLEATSCKVLNIWNIRKNSKISKLSQLFLWKMLSCLTVLTLFLYSTEVMIPESTWLEILGPNCKYLNPDATTSCL